MSMRITPLSADSLGARGMATLVETGDAALLIDPAVALGPLRYGLPPHPREYGAMDGQWGSIVKALERCDAIVVSHYHYDHHNPDEVEVLRGKRLFVKHPTESINRSQRERAAFFLKAVEGVAGSVEFCDGREFAIGKTRVSFSPPVPHGPTSHLGFVVETLVADGDDRFLHTSDIEGPCLPEHAEFILKSSPRVLFCDGPMTYLLGYRYSTESLDASCVFLSDIVNRTDIEHVALGHHLLRDPGWKERLRPVFAAAGKRGVQVGTMASFAGKREDLLEARRRELFEKSPAPRGGGRQMRGD